MHVSGCRPRVPSARPAQPLPLSTLEETQRHLGLLAWGWGLMLTRLAAAWGALAPGQPAAAGSRLGPAPALPAGRPHTDLRKPPAPPRTQCPPVPLAGSSLEPLFLWCPWGPMSPIRVNWRHLGSPWDSGACAASSSVSCDLLERSPMGVGRLPTSPPNNVCLRRPQRGSAPAAHRLSGCAPPAGQGPPGAASPLHTGGDGPCAHGAQPVQGEADGAPGGRAVDRDDQVGPSAPSGARPQATVPAAGPEKQNVADPSPPPSPAEGPEGGLVGASAGL